MKRTEFQQLAELRLEDAEVLLGAGRWGGAYYLLGYSIECALKACVAKQFRQDEIPDKRLVETVYTHNLVTLHEKSGAKDDKVRRAKSDQTFALNWNIVNDWNETSRYDLGVTEKLARDMREAVANGTSGILPWLKTQW